MTKTIYDPLGLIVGAIDEESNLKSIDNKISELIDRFENNPYLIVNVDEYSLGIKPKDEQYVKALIEFLGRQGYLVEESKQLSNITFLNKQIDPFIIAGYGSVNVVDKEGHRITVPALKEAVKNFMANPRYRNCQIFHSDIQIGEVLPFYVVGNKTYKTEVDDKGWFCVVKLRDDLEIAQKVKEEIERGNLRSFSIAGTARSKEFTCENGKCFYDITGLEVAEISVCEEGVNPEAKFDIISKSICPYQGNCSLCPENHDKGLLA